MILFNITDGLYKKNSYFLDPPRKSILSMDLIENILWGKTQFLVGIYIRIYFKCSTHQSILLFHLVINHNPFCPYQSNWLWEMYSYYNSSLSFNRIRICSTDFYLYIYEEPDPNQWQNLGNCMSYGSHPFLPMNGLLMFKNIFFKQKS